MLKGERAKARQLKESELLERVASEYRSGELEGQDAKVAVNCKRG